MSVPKISQNIRQPPPQKPFVFRWCFVTFLSFAISCQKAPKKPDVPLVNSPSTGSAATPVAPLGPAIAVTTTSAANSSKPIFAKPLTSAGENSEARFSPDGSRIIFVSQARPLHKQAQVYELHLGLMKEKRVTFHDGDDSGPLYTPDATHLLFASTTDAIKEAPYVAQRLLKSYNPKAFEENLKQNPYDTVTGSDIYEQQLNGRMIERLTRTPGFDGDPDVDNKGKRIVFSSARGDNGKFTHLYLLTGKAQTSLSDGAFIDRGARFSPDTHQLVFWRKQVDGNGPRAEAHLMLATTNGAVRQLTTGDATDIDPSWSPNGDEIIFASTRGGKSFNLFTIDQKGECIRRITEGEFNQAQPAFSPDGKRLVFTGQQSGHSNIFIVDYQKPASCFAVLAPQANPATPTLMPRPSPSPSATSTPDR